MKKTIPASIVVLVGICLGMMINSACSSGGSDAHAAAGDCSQWETGYADIGVTEVGWEPFGGYGADNAPNPVMVRRCIAP